MATKIYIANKKFGGLLKFSTIYRNKKENKTSNKSLKNINSLRNINVLFLLQPLDTITLDPKKLTTSEHTKLSLPLSLITTIISVSFLFFKEIMINEAGHFGEITGYKLGYWLWISSMIIMLIGNIKNQIAIKNH